MIFAVDSSGKSAGVCIMAGGHTVYRKTINDGFTHSQTLLELVDTSLLEAGVSLKSIKTFAVTTGPGSFTGLRIGVSLVKGLAFAQDTPIVAVSTLHAVALGCEKNGTIISALDARRNEVYWAAFAKNGKECIRISEDTASNADNLAQLVNLRRDKIVFVGDGANLCYNIYCVGEEDKQRFSVEESDIAYGAALYAAEHLEKAVKPEFVFPEYLRLSQAERERKRKLKI